MLLGFIGDITERKVFAVISGRTCTAVCTATEQQRLCIHVITVIVV